MQRGIVPTNEVGGQDNVSVYSPIPGKILTARSGIWERSADEKKFKDSYSEFL